MHSGSKFWAGESYKKTILKIRKFQENRRRQVKVLSFVKF